MMRGLASSSDSSAGSPGRTAQRLRIRPQAWGHPRVGSRGRAGVGRRWGFRSRRGPGQSGSCRPSSDGCLRGGQSGVGGEARPKAPHYPVPSAPGCGRKPRARNRSFGGGRATEAHGLVGLGSFSRKWPGGPGAGEGSPTRSCSTFGPRPCGSRDGAGPAQTAGRGRRPGGGKPRGVGGGAARPRRGGEERDRERPSARPTWRVGSEPSLCVRAALPPCPARARPRPRPGSGARPPQDRSGRARPSRLRKAPACREPSRRTAGRGAELGQGGAVLARPRPPGTLSRPEIAEPWSPGTHSGCRGAGRAGCPAKK